MYIHIYIHIHMYKQVAAQMFVNIFHRDERGLGLRA